MFNLTPKRLAVIYEYYRQLPPFERWKMPKAEEVRFCLVRRDDIQGEHSVDANGTHVIRISTNRNSKSTTVHQTMVHEMMHIAQDIAGERRAHGKGFRRRAILTGRAHDWDGQAL
jgi:hypothetical protein